MIAVVETSPGVFSPANPTAILMRDDGKARAPVQTLIQDSWSDGYRAKFGLYLVQQLEAPAGQRVVSRSYQRDASGVVRETITTAPIPAPSSVTPRQIRLALENLGLGTAVESYVAGLPKLALIEWEYATAVERSSPLIAAAATGLGLGATQVDGLFTLAASL